MRVSPNTTRQDWPLNTAPLTCSLLLRFVSGPSWWLPLRGQDWSSWDDSASSTAPPPMYGDSACTVSEVSSSCCRYRTTHNPCSCPCSPPTGPPQNWSVSAGCTHNRLLKGEPWNDLTTRDDDNESHCWIVPARAQTFTTVMPASRVAPPFRLMQFALTSLSNSCFGTLGSGQHHRCGDHRLQFKTLPKAIQGKRWSPRSTPSRPQHDGVAESPGGESQPPSRCHVRLQHASIAVPLRLRNSVIWSDMIEAHHLVKASEVDSQTMASWADIYLDVQNVVHAPIQQNPTSTGTSATKVQTPIG